MKDIPEPVKVSPIIKFFRYAFLFAGILYGATKLKAFRAIEDGRKDERERKRIEREIRLAEEKKAASDRDIAAIVAIFKGNSEADSPVTNQSNILQENKPEREEVKEVKQEVKEVKYDDKADAVSDDLSTCTMEEVKQIVQSEKTVPSPTVITEFGSVEDSKPVEESKPDSVCPKEDTANKDKGDIFSGVFNLTITDDKQKNSKSVNPRIRISPNDARSKKHAPEKSEGRQSEENGYFVETFSDKVPFVEPETYEEDFYRKDDN